MSSNLISFFTSTMQSFGCSAHDISHCYRVANLASLIAEGEISKTANKNIAFVAGLLHDTLDSKLNSNPTETESTLRHLLISDYSSFEIDAIFVIIKSVGFKNLIKSEWSTDQLPIEYYCVQDADLIDAMGAIGVCRCLAYGGKTNNPMFGVKMKIEPKLNENGSSSGEQQCIVDDTPMTAERYLKEREAPAEERSSSIQHFFDKLLILKNKITTETGKRLAEKRHNFMVLFLNELSDELAAAGDENAQAFKQKIQLFSS